MFIFARWSQYVSVYYIELDLVTVITYFVYLSNKLLREPELWSDTGEKDKTRQFKKREGKNDRNSKPRSDILILFFSRRGLRSTPTLSPLPSTGISRLIFANLIVPSWYTIKTLVVFQDWQKLFEVAEDINRYGEIFFQNHNVVCVRKLIKSCRYRFLVVLDK